MVIIVHYEPVNPSDETHTRIDAYLAAPPTKIFKRFKIVNGWGNPYRLVLGILTYRIKELNAKFIIEKSGLAFTGINKLYLKMASYERLHGFGWKPLPKVIEHTKAVVNNQNTNNRCFGFAKLYFLERPQAANRHNKLPGLYTNVMFVRNDLHDLPYPIKPADVSIYEDLLQIILNVFNFFDDEGKARYQMFISRKNYARLANLLYWDGHYEPIKNIDRLFSDITKHGNRKHFCCDVSDISLLSRYWSAINCFVRGITLSRWFTCYRDQTRMKHILNFANSVRQAAPRS